MSNPEPRVVLSLTPSPSPGRLSIEWAVRNATPTPVRFLAHPDDGHRREVVRGTPYRILTKDGGALHLFLTEPPMPPGVSFEVGFLSLSRRLEPGETYRGLWQLDVPVEEWNPAFDAPAPEAWTEVEVTRLVVETEWFDERRLSWEQTGPDEGTWWCQGFPTHSIRTEVTLSDPLPVRKRLDDFARR